MNMRQVWGLAGGFFFVYILITITNRPTVPSKPDDAAQASPAAVAPEDAATSPGAAQAPADARLRGFTLLPTDGKRLADAALADAYAGIARQGAGWVALQPAIAQPTGASAEIPADPAASLVLEDARGGVKAAKAAGLKVMLRPLVVAGDGTARDRLAPADPEAWVTSYGKALAPYLAMAEAEQVEVVCLGSRLATVQGAEAWKKVVEEARAAYHGKLTYAASHDGEQGYKKVAFWPELDYVGIDAFFPLADSPSPQARHLEAGWTQAADELEAWRSGGGGSDKPVLFTSAGVPRLVGGAADPGHPDTRAPEDEKMQAAAYEAFFKVMWTKPWLAGVFWHTWHGGPDLHDPYALVGRPALDVVRTNFAGATP